MKVKLFPTHSIMRIKLFCIVILMVHTIIYPSIHSTIGGGLSLLGGIHYPGFNIEFLLLGKPIQYLGIGGGIIYSRWGQKNSTNTMRISFHELRIPVFIRGQYNPNKNKKIWIFTDAGYDLSI